LLKRKLMRLFKDPLGTAKREFHRFLIKYKYQKIYTENLEEYWSDRLARYKNDFNLRGVGDEGTSHEENERLYLQAKDTFMSLYRNESIDFTKIRIVDIGCGSGFYAKVCFENGAKHYLGIDVTDTLLDELREKLPGFEFRKLDITKEQLEGLFDLIIMIDVTQHITDEEKFSFAMQNIKSHLADRGVFVVTSSLSERAQLNYYVVSRPLEAYRKEFPDFVFSTPLPYRDKFIFTIKRKV